MWKGTLALGPSEVPVKLYAATRERKISFRLLHASDLTPVEERMVHPRTGEPVPADEIVRGVEVRRGEYVLVRSEESRELQPPPDRTIRVSRTVARGAIDHARYARPYYLGPDGDVEGYFALAEALRARGVEGVTHWTMRKKRYSGALRPARGHLALVVLRRADEVADLPAAAPDPRERPSEEEAELADKLVEALAGDFEPSRWRDSYRDRVRELVSRRARGEEPRIEPDEPAPRAPAPDLAGALRAGLRAQEEAGRG